MVVGVAQLETVDLVEGVQAERLPIERGVVGEPDAVGGKETSGAESQSLLRLVADPVLPGVDARPRRQWLPAQLAVDGPPSPGTRP